MFCHNCGKEIARESRHCSFCGALRIVNLAEALAAGGSAAPDSGPEPRTSAVLQEECLFKIQPAFFVVGLLYGWAATMTILATVVIANLGGGIIWVLGATLALFALPLYHHLKWLNVRYTLTNAKIEIEQGILEKTSRYLSLWHIQNVTVSESLWGRLLGIGDVLIDSASAGDKMALKTIRSPRRYANLILAQLPRTK